MPVALTKQATASAAVSARRADRQVAPRTGRAVERAAAPPSDSRPWNVSHSLAKPLSGGRPLIAAAPSAEGQRRDRHEPGEAAQAVEVTGAARPPGPRPRQGTAAP